MTLASPRGKLTVTAAATVAVTAERVTFTKPSGRAGGDSGDGSGSRAGDGDGSDDGDSDGDGDGDGNGGSDSRAVIISCDSGHSALVNESVL